MTVIPADNTPPPANRPSHSSRGYNAATDRDAADRFAAALRRHDPPREKPAQQAKAPQAKPQSREEKKDERAALGFSSGGSASPQEVAAQATGAAPILDAAADIAAVPTEIVTPEKLGAMIDQLFMSAEGDETLMMRFSDILSPIEGVKVTRGDNGALGLHLTANAVHMPRLQAQIDRLRERLLARGHRIDDIQIDTDSDPAARLQSGNARW